jgi:outer membrane protein
LLKLTLNWAAYWKALRQVEIGNENKIILDKYRQNTRFRYDAGELTITDVRLAETRFQASLSKENKFLRELNRTKESLREIIKMPIPGDVDLFQVSIDKAWFPEPENALKNHPSLQPLLAELSALELDIKKQKSGHLPTLEFVSNYEYQFQGEYKSSRYPYTDGQIGLNVNIPIYEGGSVVYGTREVILRKQRQVVEIMKLKDEILRDIYSDKFDLDQSAGDIAIAQQQLIYAKETLDGMNEEYELGTRGSTDVFLVQADMINSKLDLISTKEQHVRFLMNYLFAIGKLDTATLENLSLHQGIAQ